MANDEHPLKTRSIFLCYRQEDSSDVTGRIFDRLNVEFPDEVFMDMVIPFGVDFRGYIKEVLCQCKVVLVVVGPRWTNIQDSNGLVRLTDKDDCVRFEIETALAQPGLIVIPVAVGGDGFPDKKDVEALPNTLQPLFKLNGPEVRRGRDFPHDMIELINSIRGALKREPKDIKQPCLEEEESKLPGAIPVESDERDLEEANVSEAAECIENSEHDSSDESSPCDDMAAASASIEQTLISSDTEDLSGSAKSRNIDTTRDSDPPEAPVGPPHAESLDQTHEKKSRDQGGSVAVRKEPRKQGFTAVLFKVLLTLLVVAVGSWWIKTELQKRDEARSLANEVSQKQAEAKAETDRLAKEKAKAEAALQATQQDVARLSKEKQESDRKLKEAQAESARLALEKAEMAAKVEADLKAKEMAEADQAAEAKLMAAKIAADEAEKVRKAAAEAEQRQKEWPKGASKAHPFKNSLGMIFVATAKPDLLFSIYATQVSNFKVFVDTTEYDAVSGSKNGNEAHSVQRTGDKFQWLKMGASWKDSDFPPGAKQTGDHPVVCVSYFDALNFCAWLTGKEHDEGILPPGWAYRLPTDAEWSQACGDSRYPWGEVAPPAGISGNYAGEESRLSATDVDSWKIIPGYRDGFPRTCPVGSFQPNQYGLYDMGGNVWQWCDTWYRAEMNDAETKKEWPKALDDGGGNKYRVGRGGAWSTGHESRLRSSYHDFAAPLYRDDSTGFRCVLSPVSK
ncbi:MAG: SUMF1/EgtB/PvdO family nonheme iron enzyme [Prosthecobacter sp.]|uniref:SUMF1/EgtB/PvdO family nonheme iron enzyme n=1 Tax=Prosthecobacter sp. TaxID=1965333 RepID=UPI0026107729|nr:SUMF1/EgtB/PvdO family nonheme iron enzyme [Prosthecobacter sp.]MCF7789858.1 SUMF1/EgtB/PvdO family nonheme iron enzyme [Prosthecobacter sp.]